MDLDYRLKDIEIDLDSHIDSEKAGAVRRLCIILRSIRPSCSGETKKNIEEFLDSSKPIDKAKEMCYTALDALENKKKEDDDDADY
jgi:hypothetical protein